MSEAPLCGSIISSRRGLLAFLWSITSLITLVAFLIALGYGLGNNSDDYSGNYNQQNSDNSILSVTSRALAFTALWTAVLAAILSLVGTVILGFQSPTGQYYTCCSAGVHRTTQLGLGSFIGALIMFANMTLVCGVLFGEFQIRDYDKHEGEPGEEENQQRGQLQSTASMAFSIMCLFLTILYGAFAILTYAFSSAVMEEFNADLRIDAHHRSNPSFLSSGYIHGGFDVRSSNAGTFVAPTPPKSLADSALA